MSTWSWIRFARALGRPLLVATAALGAYALLAGEPRAKRVVSAGAQQAQAEAVIRDLRPVFGDIVDTLDLTTPGVFRLALRVPSTTASPSQQTQAREQFLRRQIAQAYWSVLRRELGPVVGDTVELSFRRGVTWDVGLPGAGRSTGRSRFRASASGWRPGFATHSVARPGA